MCALVRSVFWISISHFYDRSGGVAAIVCDTTNKTQCDRGIATPLSRYGGGISVGSLSPKPTFGLLYFSGILGLVLGGPPDHPQSPKPRKPPLKVSKILPRGVWDPPDPPKSSEKCPKRLRNSFAPYRGRNPQNREKRVSESKNPHFPPPQKRVFRVKKSPFSL